MLQAIISLLLRVGTFFFTIKRYVLQIVHVKNLTRCKSNTLLILHVIKATRIKSYTYENIHVCME